MKAGKLLLPGERDEVIEMTDGRKRIVGVLKAVANLLSRGADPNEIERVLNDLEQGAVSHGSRKLRPEQTDLEAQEVAGGELPKIFSKITSVMREGVSASQIQDALNSELKKPVVSGTVTEISQK